MIGPAATIPLLARMDLREVARSFSEVNWAPLGLALVMMGPLFLIKAWRWRLLLSACGRAVTIAEATRLYIVAAGAGAVTPGAIGDFSKGFSQSVGGRAIGIWTSAVDRLYDVAALIGLGFVITVAWLPDDRSRIGALLVVAIVALGAWGLRGSVASLIRSLYPEILDHAAVLRQTAGMAALGTLLSVVVAFARFELLVVSLRLPIGLWPSFVAFTLTSGVAALPLSIAGVGTRDWALLGYLRGYGVGHAQSIALSSLCLLLLLWNGVVGMCVWFVKPRL
jgi:uncharacterized membrane protein YbhN (UPF0104 family)